MNNKRATRKAPAALVGLIVLLCCTVAGTLAYLITSTDPLVNTFTPTKVTTTIVEDFDYGVKEKVKVKNTGDINAYIRAAVVVNWVDDEDNIHADAPVAGTDYTIEWNVDTDSETNKPWFRGSDGFYYHKATVAASESTGILINECKPVEGKAPQGYYLQVTILAEGIQAEPAGAVQSAWPTVTVDENGKLTAAAATTE